MNQDQKIILGTILYDLLAQELDGQEISKVSPDRFNALEAIFADYVPHVNSADLALWVCDWDGDLSLTACIGCF